MKFVIILRTIAKASCQINLQVARRDTGIERTTRMVLPPGFCCAEGQGITWCVIERGRFS